MQANNSVKCGYFWIGFIDFMLAGKKLTDYTSFFSPHDSKNQCNSIEAIDKTNLTNQTKFPLDEISKI